MNWRKVLVYVAFGLGALLLVRLVLSLIFGVLGFIWTILMTVVTVVVAGAILYGGYKLFSWVRGDSSSSASQPIDEDPAVPTNTEPVDRVEKLKERYANDELSEAEFERRLELELDEPRVDNPDRELHEERE